MIVFNKDTSSTTHDHQPQTRWEHEVPDDLLFDGVVEGHEEVRVLSDATDKVPDKDVQAVRGRGLDPC